MGVNDKHTTNGFLTERDIVAYENTPLSERSVPETTYKALKEAAENYADKTALTFFMSGENFDEPFTWNHQDLFRDVTRAANAFRRLGVGRKDVIAYILPNLPDSHMVIWGGEAAGVVFAINPSLSIEEISKLLRAASAKVLVTMGETPGLDMWEKAIAAASNVPSLERILTVDLGRYSGLDAPGSSGVEPNVPLPVSSFVREIEAENAESLNFPGPTGDDLSSFFCTGGTTGLPKIAKRTHFGESFDCWSIKQFIPDLLHDDSNVFCGLPLFHVNAQLVSGLATFMNGGNVVLATPGGYRGPGVFENFWKIVEKFEVTAFSGVPTVYSALLAQPVSDADISSLKYGMCGAAPMPVELFNRFQDEIGVRIFEGYGLTEGTCVSSLNPPEAEPRIGSIGLRLPYQQMMVCELDADGAFSAKSDVDVAGSILIKGPNVFAGYAEDVHNKGVWVEIDGERWFNTGDLARQDEDGFFWMTGRKKELIIRGGHNIDPKSIEEPAHKHPKIAMAAAVGRPDAHSGEVPVLFVQAVDGVNLDPAEIEEHLKQEVAERAALPKRIEVLANMPLTAVGKIFKPALTMMQLESVVRETAARLNVKLDAVAVRQDAKLGMVTTVETSDFSEDLERELAKFTFRIDFRTKN